MSRQSTNFLYPFLLTILFSFGVACMARPFFTAKIQKLPHKVVSNTDTATPRVYILDSAKVRVTQHMQFRILVLEQLKNKEAQKHNGLSIIIQKKKDKGYDSLVENKELIFKDDENCMIGEYSKITVKNNYFTIEQVYCKGFMYVQSYCTFRIDQAGNIFLHKYGEEYTDRSNPDRDIPTVTKSSTDFGRIKFKKVTEDFLMQLMQDQ